MSKVKDQLQAIMRDTFENNQLEIYDEMTAENVEEWDSLSHIELIVNIETDFSIKLTVDDIIDLKNVGEMIQLLATKSNQQ